MALDRLKQVADHVTATNSTSFPLDPLSTAEIEQAVAVVKRQHGQLAFNAVTVFEPPKKELQAWLANPGINPKPRRVADVVAIGRHGTVYDGLVDLKDRKVVKWETTEGVQPLVMFPSRSKGWQEITIPDYNGRSSDRRARGEGGS